MMPIMMRTHRVDGPREDDARCDTEVLDRHRCTSGASRWQRTAAHAGRSWRST